jgi:hypothetical protein
MQIENRPNSTFFLENLFCKSEFVSSEAESPSVRSGVMATVEKGEKESRK